LGSIFPNIFEEEPVEDLISLHCRLFSLQFSSAKVWLDSGLKVDTLIGHSFGQLTALCVSDSITCKDALRLISGRARLIQEQCQEVGIMLSIEGDRKDVESLVDTVNSQDGFHVDFAVSQHLHITREYKLTPISQCYNGPRNFVLAGDKPSIEKFEDVSRSPDSSRRFKVIRLKNSHAYHSRLMAGILPDLVKLASSIEIRNPSIPVETCSKDRNWSQFTADEIAKHTREPVYFFEAVERIAVRLPSAVWLEAGSATPIINMARRILESRTASNLFISMDLGPRDAFKSLANAATQLWISGSEVHYWPFQRSHKSRYTMLYDLPPYQFEKAQHWIRYKPSNDTKAVELARSSNARESDLLVSLVRHDNPSEAVFSVDTFHALFQLAARGHAVAGHSLCPASMYIELVAICARELIGNISERVPEVEDLTMSAPLGLSVDVNVFVRITKTGEWEWHFAVLSKSQRGFEDIEHAKGSISLSPVGDSSSVSQMKLLKQLARYSRTDEILASPWATGISGSMVYKIFADVVKYAPYFRGVTSLFALENEAVGQVTVPSDGKFDLPDQGVSDPIILDNFLQVAGIHVNCLSERKSDEVFMCTAIERVIFSRQFMVEKSKTRSWIVYSRYEKSGKNISNNIFVFDAASKSLVLSVIGATFRSVPFKSVVKSLAKLNAGTTIEVTNEPDSGYSSPPDKEDEEEEQYERQKPLSPPKEPRPVVNGLAKSSQLIQNVRRMFAEIIEIPLDEVETTSTLDELGVDSLLVTEVQGEVQKRFNVNITPAEFLLLDNVLSVCLRIDPSSVEKPHSQIDERVKEFPKKNSPNGSPELRDISGFENGAETSLAAVSYDSFSKVKGTYDEHADTTGFVNFCTDAFPLQSELVVQYVIEAFASLGCDLSAMNAEDIVPMIPHIAAHVKVVPQLYKILQTSGLIKEENGVYRRSTLVVPKTPSSVLHEAMLKYTQHTSETKLLHATGPRLADCLSGKADPVGLIFRDSVARVLLSDVYLNAPMFKAGTMILARYLSEVLDNFGGKRELRILELGAGTGGTTSYLLEALVRSENKFQYTFTDLSSSLVMAAKRKFAKYPFMHYSVLDIEKDPDTKFLGAYDIIISTNCIHATKDLVLSTTNIRKMLRKDGILCLCELTRNLYWFDLVFGLLEGWWLFNDGRKHVLADENRWASVLQTAGYQWVDWSDSPSKESDILRVITASPFKVRESSEDFGEATNSVEHVQEETLVFKEVNGLELRADIYYPAKTVEGKKLPVGE
jgi:malonyl CoA-acyl carrier protein transacylase/SAM-dependent methyltransferase/acyl carrier protein